MSFWEIIAIIGAGIAAGAINTIVGSGTLITFPTLLAFGIAPVTANMSNSVGLVAGGLSGTWGYRKELQGKGDHLKQLVPCSFVGAVVGALALLVLPSSAFSAIVPVLILVGIALVLLGPWLNRRATARRAASEASHDAAALSAAEHTDIHPDTVDATLSGWRLLALSVGIFAAGIYGGYFGAAQGVIVIGVMSALSTISLQEINGIKNVLSTVVNLVAAITFILVAGHKINWEAAVLVAVGSLIGGFIGARVGRRLNPWVLRAFIVVIGLAAVINLLR